jgi:hypothetical protein
LVYDWRDDPVEVENLLEAEPDRDAELRRELADRIRRLADVRDRQRPEAALAASEEQQERLQALGYVE